VLRRTGTREAYAHMDRRSHGRIHYTPDC
jgi:hypothetical protein